MRHNADRQSVEQTFKVAIPPHLSTFSLFDIISVEILSVDNLSVDIMSAYQFYKYMGNNYRFTIRNKRISFPVFSRRKTAERPSGLRHLAADRLVRVQKNCLGRINVSSKP